MNVDSFEHLEFETRPDQLLVYALVQGDERVVHRVRARRGDGDARRPRQLAVRHGGFVQMELMGLDGADGVAEPRRRDAPAAQRPRSPRTYGMPSAAGAPIRLRIASRDPTTSTTITRAYGSISRKNVSRGSRRTGWGRRGGSAGPACRGSAARSRRRGRRPRPPGTAHWAKITSPIAIQPRPLTVRSPNQPGWMASVIVAPARPASSPPTNT